MLRKLFFISIIISCCVSQSFAFDGERKGFFVDLGMGYSGYNIWEVSTGDKLKDVNSFVFNISLGFAFDDKNPFVLETIRIGEFLDKSDGFEHNVTQVVVSWYHYLKPKNKSIFTIIGIGKYYYNFRFKTGYIHSKRNGLGFVAGLGYEFAKGKNIKLYYLFGHVDYGQRKSTFYVPYFSLSMSLF